MDGDAKQPEPVASNGAQARGVRVTIVTDLPEKLPVVRGEVAIIRAYLSELIARIAMNDNEDEA